MVVLERELDGCCVCVCVCVSMGWGLVQRVMGV
jgi:hypothetical protein